MSMPVPLSVPLHLYLGTRASRLYLRYLEEGNVAVSATEVIGIIIVKRQRKKNAGPIVQLG